MVHRPPDSRLLANLINHEKDYTKHLTALFPLSHAALAALSAYAAASPSSHPASPAHTIAAIVDVLASADDAFQRYTQAIDTWREQLVALKVLEDDLSAILRDRDILVTRLIKASKSTRDAHRSSRLVAPLSSLGSASNSSLPSTVSLSGHSPANTNPKLAEAQAELQACEAHLAAKERELDARRITLARDGLGARCRALIDCGWVWGEIGKQGLKVLQALSGDGSGDGSNLSAPKPSLAIPSRQNPNTNPTTYASDNNSSLTPSQSASQTAARSIETSHEGPSSKEHEHLQPDEKQETTTSKSKARPARASDDLTITLPPAYAISELALPTGVLAQPPSPENGDSTATPNAGTQPAPALIRKRTKRSRRPISQHIAEASHEDSDGPSSVSNRNATASPRVPHTSFPNTSRMPANDTSSDDEQPTGPLQVVENDPFEVIRRSMLGPTGASASPLLAGTAPTARASAPDVRASASYDTSPSKIMFPASVSGHGQRGGIGMGSPSTSQASPKRQRRTSLLFFGSLRGLFRKTKERGRVGADWDDGHSSPSPSSSNLTRAKTSGGWVTRTDARVKGRSGEDSDEEAMSKEVGRRKTTATATTTTNEANVGRSASRARLRKGRPGASNGTSVAPSHRAGVDGWITDSPGGAGAGTATASGSGAGAGAGPSRSRTRRGTMKRKKMSVAELRGNDQGHTDGEVDGAHQPLERVSSAVRGKAPEATVSRPIAEVQEKQVAAPTNPNPTADPNVSVSPGTQPRRATTTTATSSRKPSSGAALAHRRSASMSYVDAQMATAVASTSTQAMPMSTSTGGSMSWRKPPPQIEPQSQQVSPSEAQPQSLSRSPSQAQAQPSSRTHESQPKPNARRHLSNGHAKHAQNQSLMSIVADVTRLSQDEDQALVMDKARSLDIPRAPGSVLRGQDVGGAQRGGMNGAGHGRTTSEDVGAGQAQAQAQRDIKMPLRSALRNASRTPSPSPVTVPAIVPAGQVRKEAGVEEQRGRGSGSVSPPWRDSASISSYETGRESWDGEPSSPVRSQSRSPVVRSQSQPPATRRAQSPVLINHVDARPSTRSRSPSPPPFTFPPPPVDPPPVRPSNMHSHSKSVSNLNGNRASNGTGNGNDPPSSNVSTETPPVRRKSVRVSLPPTFSPTPPALHDEDGDDDGGGAGERYAPWNGREPPKTNTKTTTGDVWADSSEEDEVYKHARRLLSLVGRGRT